MRSKYNKRKKRSCLGQIVTGVVVTVFVTAVAAGAYLGYAKYQGKDVGATKDKIEQTATMGYQQGKVLFRRCLDSLGSILKIEGSTGWQSDQVQKEIEKKVVIDPEVITESTPEAQKAKEYYEALKSIENVVSNSPNAEYTLGNGKVYTNEVLNYNGFFLHNGILHADLDMASGVDGDYRSFKGIYRMRFIVDEEYYNIETYDDLLKASKIAVSVNLAKVCEYYNNFDENYEDEAEIYFETRIKNTDERMLKLQEEGYDLSLDYGQIKNNAEYKFCYGFGGRIKAKNSITGDEKYVYYDSDFGVLETEAFIKNINDNNYQFNEVSENCYFETDSFYSEFAKAQKIGTDFISQKHYLDK